MTESVLRECLRDKPSPVPTVALLNLSQTEILDTGVHDSLREAAFRRGINYVHVFPFTENYYSRTAESLLVELKQFLRSQVVIFMDDPTSLSFVKGKIDADDISKELMTFYRLDENNCPPIFVLNPMNVQDNAPIPRISLLDLIRMAITDAENIDVVIVTPAKNYPLISDFFAGFTVTPLESGDEPVGGKYPASVKDGVRSAVVERMDVLLQTNPYFRGPPYDDVLFHASLCRDYYQSTPSRAVDEIRAYLRGGETTPLLISGKSGCGKSTALATAAIESWKEFSKAPDEKGDMNESASGDEDKPAEKEATAASDGTASTPAETDCAPAGKLSAPAKKQQPPLVLYRIAGMSRRSLTVEAMVQSMLDQVRQGCPGVSTKVDAKATTGEQLLRYLEACAKEFPVWLFLDELDKLNELTAGSLYWMTLKLPPNVKLVVSAANNGVVASTLKSWLACQTHSIAKLDAPMDVVRSWLEKSHRTMRKAAFETMEDCLARDGRPITFRIFNMFLGHLPSYAPILDLPYSVHEMLHLVVRGIHQDCGQMLTQLTCALVAVARGGLSDLEICDIARSQSVSVETWGKLRSKLPALMIEGIDACNLPVWKFKHQLVLSVIEECFLPSTEDRRNMHIFLSRYFAGTLTTSDGYSRKQPVMLSGNLGAADAVPNTRRLCTDVYHAMKAMQLLSDGHTWRRTPELHLTEASLGSLEYMLACCSVGLLGDLGLYYSKYLSIVPDLERDVAVRSMAKFYTSQYDLLRVDGTQALQRALLEKPGSYVYSEACRLAPDMPLPQLQLQQLHGPNRTHLFTLRARNIHRVKFSPSGSRFALCAGKEVRVHDTVTSQLLFSCMHEHRPHAVVWFRDESRFASGGLDQGVTVWGAKAGEEGKMLQRVHLGRNVFDLTLSPRETLLAAATDRGAVVLDAESRDLETTIAFKNKSSTGIRCLAFTRAGAVLATGGKDGHVILWRAGDVTTQAHADRIIADWRDHQSEVEDLCFSPDGRFLATAGLDHLCLVYDVGTHDLLHKIRCPCPYQCVAFSPDAKLLLASGVSDLEVFSVEDGRQLDAFHIHENHVRSLSVSPDGERLLTCGDDDTLMAWDFQSVRNGLEQNRDNRRQDQDADGLVVPFAAQMAPKFRSVSWFPDGERVVACGDSEELLVCSRSTSDTVEIKPPEDEYKQRVWCPDGRSKTLCVCVSRDGQFVYAGGEDRCLRVYRMPDGHQVQVFPDDHSSDIVSLRVSPSGRFLWSNSAMENDMCLYDINPTTGLLASEPFRVLGVGFDAIMSSDDKYVYVSRKSCVEILTLQESNEVFTYKLRRNFDVFSFAVGARALLAGLDDGSLAVFERQTLPSTEGSVFPRTQFNGHEGAVRRIHALPPHLKSHFITGGHDDTLRLWAVNDDFRASCLHSLHLYGPVDDISIVLPAQRGRQSGGSANEGANEGANEIVRELRQAAIQIAACDLSGFVYLFDAYNV
eukprot:Rmarinus@m.12936